MENTPLIVNYSSPVAQDSVSETPSTSTEANTENQVLEGDTGTASNEYEPQKSTVNATENTVHTEKQSPLRHVSTDSDIVNTGNKGPSNDINDFDGKEPLKDDMLNTTNATVNTVHT